MSEINLTKKYYSISEVCDMFAVKDYTLRYWEQEFPQLRPHKRAGNRRYYQEKDINLIKDICELLYKKGYTIAGARDQLSQAKQSPPPIQLRPKHTNVLEYIKSEIQDILTRSKQSKYK